MLHQRTERAGLGMALLSAATFGTSGSFARSLTSAGWSPAAAVAARISAAALILALPAAVLLRGRWAVLRRNIATITIYGVLAVAGAQVCFFNAIQTLSVGVALLLEYSGTVLVVVWMWGRHGHRPRRLTAAGSAVALLGLVFMLDLVGDSRLDAVGVLWGLGAAIGLATFFVMSADTDSDLPPVVVASSGMIIGAATLFGLGALGALPMHATFGNVAFAGHRVSWLIPLVGLSLVAAAVAYVAGIAAARLLGPKLASFVGLTEVVFAVLFAWLLLGELPGGMQLFGGALIVAGIALVRIDELRPAPVRRAVRPGVPAR
ncbi:MAG: EamA family transporter [Pseudonocardiales bacterium]|nr:MAG: EamA family transporter [Pseudonocardiales bacterium]